MQELRKCFKDHPVTASILKTGEQLLMHNQPDAVEILPGIADPYFI